MIYNKYRLFILLRVAVLFGFMAGSIISYYETNFVVTPIMLSLLTLISTCELIWYLHKLQRSWANFLLSIKHQDFNRHNHDPSEFPQLQEAYDLITQSFENLKTNKHADLRLLQTVSEHIQIGLVCYHKTGEVVFSNKKIRSILGLEAFLDIESLRNFQVDIYNYLISDQTVSGALVEGKNEQRILIKTEAFSLQNKSYKLASLYDIKSTLDTNELESYQKLMKVMTHEIMNSTTPVLSLIQVINKKLIHDDEQQLNHLHSKDQQNIATSLKAVETRTNGMLKFVEAYRKINRVIKPNLEWTHSKTLLSSIKGLVIDQSNINYTFHDYVNKELKLDSDLISQTILNLLKNAREAAYSSDKPEIKMIIERSNKDLSIVIEDNGDGVLSEDLSEIFVPFYTTKSTGSGVGLALSRKIVKAHGGNLTYQRTTYETTQFQILLPSSISE